MSITKITDHEARMIAHMLGWFGDEFGVPIMRKLLEVFAAEVQEVENALYDLIVLRYLDTAVGVQLDQYGAILGLPRNGLSDDAYRAALLTKIRSNASGGIIPVALDIVRTIIATELTSGVEYIPLHPAGYALQYRIAKMHSITPELRETLIDVLLAHRASGVELTIEETSENAIHPYFGFDHDSNAAGFNDAGGGGFLTSRIVFPRPQVWALPATENLESFFTTADSRVFEDVADGAMDLTLSESYEVAGVDSPASASAWSLLDLGSEYDRFAGMEKRGAFLVQTASHVRATILPTDGDFSVMWRTRLIDGTNGVFLAQYGVAVSGRFTIELEDGNWRVEIDDAAVLEWGASNIEATYMVVRSGSSWVAYDHTGAVLDSATDSSSILDNGTTQIGSRSSDGDPDGDPTAFIGVELFTFAAWLAALDSTQRSEAFDADAALHGAHTVENTVLDVLLKTSAVAFLYPFTDTSGPAVDLIAGKTGALGGGVSTGGIGLVRGVSASFDFNGSGSAEVTVSDANFPIEINPGNSFSLLMFVRQDFTPTTNLGFFSKQATSATEGIQAFTIASQLRFRYRDDLGNQADAALTPSVGSITSGYWLVAFRYDGVGDLIYLSAAEIGYGAELEHSSVSTSSVVGDVDNTQPFLIGDSTSTTEWEGQMQLVTGVQRFMSDDELQFILNQAFAASQH